jgi:hypothetical protein
MIPKIIWQTHELPYEDLPSFQKSIINTWKNLNPGWIHNYADANARAECVKNFDKKLYAAYLIVPKVNQADIWRYVVVYQNGGVYADMDSVCALPLDETITKNYNNQDLMCTEVNWGNHELDGEQFVNNSNFAAPKNSKILLLAIEDIKFGYRMILEGYVKSYRTIQKFLPWDAYSNAVIENKENVLFSFDCAIHSQEFKKSFHNYNVTFNNKTYNYLDLAKLQNWNI